MEFSEELKTGLDNVKKEIKEAVKIEIENATSGLITGDMLTQKLDELGLKASEIKELTEAVTKQGVKINELAASQTTGKLPTIREYLEKNMEALKASKETKTKMFLNIPMIRKDVTVNSSITTDGGGYMIPGFEDYPTPPTSLVGAFGNVISLPANHHGIIRYTYQSTNTWNGAMTAEGSSGTASVHAWTSASVTVEKALADEKISYEAMTDTVEMEAAVRRLLSLELFDIRETQFYTGTGTAPQINGLYTRGTTWDYSAWTGITTTQANTFDLCMLLKSELSRLYGAKFIPDTVLMNPTDWLAAQWVKDSNGVYVRNPFASPDGLNVAGMRIILSPKVTANTLMVGDSRYATLYLGDNIEIELGYDTGDFRDDLVTMKARHRFATKISPVDALGWYKVTSITAACAAITTAGA